MYSPDLRRGNCVKKCASCSKDLPEAALHCVFCGAKQAPAPAVGPGVAKTAFGYSANEVMQQLGNPNAQQAQQPYGAPRANNPSQPGYVTPSPQSNAATVMMPPGSGPPAASPYGAPPQPAGFGGNPSPGFGGPPQGGFGGNPSPGFGGPPGQGGGYGGAPQQGGYGGTPPQGGYGGAPQQGGYGGAPQQGGYGGPQLGGGGMGIHSPHQPTPNALPTTQQPPYRGSQAAARAGRPIEPWQDSLKLLMLVWGAVALAAFATPMSLTPMGFNWDLIIDGPGKMKIPPLIWAAAGLLSIACAALPMAALPRGIIAAVLGLAGILTPLFMGAELPWQAIVMIVGLIALVPGLLVRHEYTESLLARVLVTVGVVCTLLPLLAPTNGEIPLVGLFKGLIEAPGEDKIRYILQVLFLVVIVMSLLAWMPGPATGAGKIFAWTIILFPVLEFALSLLLEGKIGVVVAHSPGLLVSWVPQLVYSVLVGYGVATVIGKQLE